LGGEGNDTLAGGLGADSLEGGLGHDFLNGGDGNDVLNGGDGKDRILGGEGNDTINGGAGNDAVSTDLYADDTNDVILKSKGKDTLNAQATPNFPISTFTGDIEAYEPSQMRRAYGFGDLDDPTYTNRGKGQAIAIVDAFHSPTARADLIRFSKEFGLPLPTKKTFIQTYASGKRPTEDMGWTGETLLDIQWAHAIAPQATIILVEADSALQGDIAAAITTATKLLNKWFGGGVISLSLGSAESATSRVRDSLFNNRNTKNISFVVAAGDTPEPSWPATNPNVLSVGGTSLFLDQYGNRVGGTIVDGFIGDTMIPAKYLDGWEDTLTTVVDAPVLGGERS
jgi:subtilase family serine protease